MAQATAATLELNNGVQMPALGLGVFQTPPDETRDAVRAALGMGYRHIDTAAAYGNEREVGEAVRSSELDRAEIFLETKIWISDYGFDETLHGFEKSARKLGVEQIDLLIAKSRRPESRGKVVGPTLTKRQRPLGSGVRYTCTRSRTGVKIKVTRSQGLRPLIGKKLDLGIVRSPTAPASVATLSFRF